MMTKGIKERNPEEMEKLRRSPYAHVISTPKGYAFFERLPNAVDKFPQYGSDEIVVQPLVISVCGSDVHAHRQDGGTHPFAKHPLLSGEKSFIPFHEGVGKVMAVGDGVKGLEVGDRVAIESTIFSDDCPPGRWSQTPNGKMKIVGLGSDGLGAELAVLPAKVAIPIPKGVPDELGAQFEPLGVSVHAWMRGMYVYEATTGKDPKKAWFLINGGTGSVGGLALASLIAESVPVDHIIATGTTPAKLDALREKYPKLNVFNLKEKAEIQRVHDRLVPQLEKFGGVVPIVIEATGHDPAPIITFIGKGTVFVVVGLSSDVQPGENLVDNNNSIVRSQRTILTPGDRGNDQLIDEAKAVFKETVTKEKNPKILQINPSIDISNLLTQERQFDIIVDRIGFSPRYIDKLLRKGGIWITKPVVGNSPLPMRELLTKGAVVTGSWGRDRGDWKVMIDQVKEGRLKVDELPITLYPFSEEGLKEAFENARKGKVGFNMRRLKNRN